MNWKYKGLKRWIVKDRSHEELIFSCTNCGWEKRVFVSSDLPDKCPFCKEDRNRQDKESL